MNEENRTVLPTPAPESRTTAAPPGSAAAPAPTAAVDGADDDARVDEIVARGPVGAFVLAGITTAMVLAIYLLFYALAYLPRGSVQ